MLSRLSSLAIHDAAGADGALLLRALSGECKSGLKVLLEVLFRVPTVVGAAHP